MVMLGIHIQNRAIENAMGVFRAEIGTVRAEIVAFRAEMKLVLANVEMRIHQELSSITHRLERLEEIRSLIR